jgi:hypothetical protein
MSEANTPTPPADAADERSRLEKAVRALADSEVEPKPNNSTKVSDWLNHRDIDRAARAVLAATTASASPSERAGLPWKPIDDAAMDGRIHLVRFSRPNVFETPDGKHQDWFQLAMYGPDQPPLTPSKWQTIWGQGFPWLPTHYIHRDVLLSAAPALPASADDARDAARWRAFIGSGHLSLMGWAGFDAEGKSRHNAKHFCLNVWEQPQVRETDDDILKHNTAETRKRAETILLNYVDSIATHPTGSPADAARVTEEERKLYERCAQRYPACSTADVGDMLAIISRLTGAQP